MKKITTQEEYISAIQSNKISVMVWTANWCPDCVFMKPFLPDIVSEFSNMDFYLVDRDGLLDLAASINILGIPSFICYKDGKEISRFVSKLRKTKEEIVQFLKVTEEKGD